MTCECGGARSFHRHQGARGTVRGGDAAVPGVRREAPASPSWPRGPSPGKRPRLREALGRICHLPSPDFGKESAPDFPPGTRSPGPPRGLDAAAAAFVKRSLGAASAGRWVYKQPARSLRKPRTGQTLGSLAGRCEPETMKMRIRKRETTHSLSEDCEGARCPLISTVLCTVKIILKIMCFKGTSLPGSQNRRTSGNTAR